MAAVVVQPGRWVLQAKAFVGTLNARAAGTCTLHMDTTHFVIGGVLPGQTVALLDIGEFGTETRIPLMCSTFPGSEATLQILDGVVLATRVGGGTA